jgi:nucleotide-binding universal stress UspA family protein
LIAIASMEGWVSPLLGIRFTRQNGDLEIYRADGRRFLSSVELDRRAEQALDEAEAAQAQAQAAQAQAQAAQAQAEAERVLRLAAEARMAEMIEQMRRLGIEPE